MDDRITRIEASEADLPALLRKITEEGREYIITDHGKPVARVLPENEDDKKNVGAIIREWETLQSRCTLGGISWKELRDEGRK